MKTVRFIETPEELVSMASGIRAQGDETPSLPGTATLVFTETQVHLVNAPGFSLEGKFWEKSIVINCLVELAGMNAQFGLDEDQ